MPNVAVVLSPPAVDDIRRIGDPETLAAVTRTMEEDLAPRRGGSVRMWQSFPMYLYIPVLARSPAENELSSLDLPDDEPDDALPATYFILYKPLTPAQSRELEGHGNPRFLILRIFRIVDILRPQAWAMGIDSGILTYINTIDRAVAQTFSEALRDLLASADYEIVVEGRDEWGSWIKNWLTRARHLEAPRRLAEGVVAAANDTYARQPAAAATKDLADAMKTALDAMGDNEGCVIFDNLLVAQARQPDGTLQSFAKELTLDERKFLREHPERLWNLSAFISDLRRELGPGDIGSS